MNGTYQPKLLFSIFILSGNKVHLPNYMSDWNSLMWQYLITNSHAYLLSTDHAKYQKWTVTQLVTSENYNWCTRVLCRNWCCEVKYNSTLLQLLLQTQVQEYLEEIHQQHTYRNTRHKREGLMEKKVTLSVSCLVGLAYCCYSTFFDYVQSKMEGSSLLLLLHISYFT